jgi:dynein heavy chain
LDADDVKDEVDNMWQTLYKLAKILYDIPGAKRVAEMIRAKVEKFRQYMPLLQVICNKGLQARHWQQVIWNSRIFLKVYLLSWESPRLR